MIKKNEIEPAGSWQNILERTPVSNWSLARDWAKWKDELPNAYTYRLRVIGKDKKPIALKRKKGIDIYGLLYVGETGIKNNQQSMRGEKLAHGVIDKTVIAHSAARKYWKMNWDQMLAKIDADFELEFGWDEQKAFTMPANKNELLQPNQQKDEMITNSGKGFAMQFEDETIRVYVNKYGEFPPLNKAQSPGMRNRDRQSKRTLQQDLEDRSDGIIEGI